VAPAAGTHNLIINGISGCGWNVIYEIYSGVDQVTPIGSVATATGTAPSNPYTVTASITTGGPASLVSDYLQTDQLTPPDGPGQVSFGVASNCCETVFGDYKDVGGPGAQTLTYTYTQTGKRYAYEAIEIRGAANCNSPTPSPIVSPTDTPSASPTATPTHTPVPTATPTATRTVTNTRTPTPLPLLLTPHHPNPDPTGGDTVYLPFTITVDSTVSIKVYDIAGEMVVSPGSRFFSRGNQEWPWDLMNTARQRVSSGVYLCRIEADAAGGQSQVVWEKCSVLH
ncbi:MAG TPA: hypothetical protein VNZ54_04720, partial [bacterium]|nr:hypothetical protein [bacterium]